MELDPQEISLIARRIGDRVSEKFSAAIPHEWCVEMAKAALGIP